MYTIVCLLIVVILGLTYLIINLTHDYRDLRTSWYDENHQKNKFRLAIAQHRLEVRKDPCWQHDCVLWAALGDNDTEWPHGRYSSKKEMRDGCRAYIDGCFDHI